MSNPNRDFCRSIRRLSGVRAAGAALALLASQAHALPEDQQQPIHVTADAAVQENDTVTYKGNVVIVQGTIKINADQVLIYHDKGKLQRAVATGKPVRFQEQPDTKGGLMTGHALTVIYYNVDQRVELIQEALVDRDQSTLKGQRIEYIMPTQVLRADGATPSSQPGRVEMVLQPNQDKNKEAPKTDAAPADGQGAIAPAATPAPGPSPTPAPTESR